MDEIRVVHRGYDGYPGRLQEIPGPPDKLYLIGRLPEEARASVAVIGARDCSEYGRQVATRLGDMLGRRGIQVISGMARGIDGIAQEAAVRAGGSSFAVLGSGVDVCYPARNRALYERLKTSGGILSEYPPGTPAMPRNFPPRNRIVSGLADAVIVVEARAKSGTLITVDMALEQGREVYAVPGRLTDGLSAGCNRLLKLGAGLLLDTEEFLEELRAVVAKRGILFSGTDAAQRADGGQDGGQESRSRPTDAAQRADGGESGTAERACRLFAEVPKLRSLYGALDVSPKSPAQIREELAEEMKDNQIAAGLMRLCMEQLAVQVSPGQFCVRAPDLTFW